MTRGFSRPARILIHDLGGYPFVAQLARELASRRHAVLYLHAGGLRTPRGIVDSRQEDPPGLTIDGVGLQERVHIGAGPRRFLQERRYAQRLAQRIEVFRPDVVVSSNGPLDAHAAAAAAASRVGSAYVYWIQDVYSVAIRELLARRLPVLGPIIAYRYEALERHVLRSSHAVIATSSDFLPLLERWGVRQDRVSVIPNWANLDEIPPQPRRNAWSRRHELDDKNVLLYAGTLGRKHNPGRLLDLADSAPDAKVVVIAEGTGADELRLAAVGRPNLHMLPLQPAAELPQVLAAADVLVALLEPEASRFSVPSKVLTYMAAARPILAAIPHDNLAARTIEAAGAGVVVDPHDRDGFIASARGLMLNSDRRSALGTSGRRYAEEFFEIGQIADQFEDVFARASQPDAASGVAAPAGSRSRS